jgi:hypothetical protein
MSSSLRDVFIASGCPRRFGVSSSLRGSRHRLRLHELCELGSSLVFTVLGAWAPVVAVLHHSCLNPGTSLCDHPEPTLDPVHPGGTFSLLRLYGPRKFGPGWRPKGGSPSGVARDCTLKHRRSHLIHACKLDGAAANGKFQIASCQVVNVARHMARKLN